MKCFDSVCLGKGLTSLAGLCVKGVALYSFRLCVLKGFKMQSLVRDSFFVGKILRGDLVLIGIHRSQVFNFWMCGFQQEVPTPKSFNDKRMGECNLEQTALTAKQYTGLKTPDLEQGVGTCRRC